MRAGKLKAFSGGIAFLAVCVAGLLSGCASGHNEFVYAAGPGTNEAFEFRVQSNGALLPLGTPNFPTGSNPAALLPHTSGDFLYIADFSGNDVTLLDINASDGNLSVPVSTSIVSPVNPTNIFATDIGPISLAMSPTSPFLYVVNQTSGKVNGYTVDPGSGSLGVIQVQVCRVPVRRSRLIRHRIPWGWQLRLQGTFCLWPMALKAPSRCSALAGKEC